MALFIEKDFDELGIMPNPTTGATVGSFEGWFYAEGGIIEDIFVNETRWDAKTSKYVTTTRHLKRKADDALFWFLHDALEDRYSDDIEATSDDANYRPYRDEIPGGTSAGRSM